MSVSKYLKTLDSLQIIIFIVRGCPPGMGHYVENKSASVSVSVSIYLKTLNSRQILTKNIWNFSNNILPLRWGRIEVGVDKIETIWSPLPFIPSHRREGRFLGDILEKVRDKFSDFLCKNLIFMLRAYLWMPTGRQARTMKIVSNLLMLGHFLTDTDTLFSNKL